MLVVDCFSVLAAVELRMSRGLELLPTNSQSDVTPGLAIEHASDRIRRIQHALGLAAWFRRRRLCLAHHDLLCVKSIVKLLPWSLPSRGKGTTRTRSGDHLGYLLITFATHLIWCTETRLSG